MRIYLDVKFSDKDRAKELGAIWDAENRKWYTENPTKDLLAEFGFGNPKGYNSNILGRLETQCEQHCIEFKYFKMDFDSKYDILKTENLTIPLFSSIEETINYLTDNNIIKEKEEFDEYKLTPKEMKSYLIKLMVENEIERNIFVKLGEDEKNKIQKALETGLRSELNKEMKRLNFIK